jgi:hypothetical protein
MVLKPNKSGITNFPAQWSPLNPYFISDKSRWEDHHAPDDNKPLHLDHRSWGINNQQIIEGNPLILKVAAACAIQKGS